MTSTLFDCDHCAATRAEIAELREQLAWMRHRLANGQMANVCDRCLAGHGWNGCGYTDRYGLRIWVCGSCWRPGDTYHVAGMTLHVERVDRLRFAVRGRSVVVEAVNPRPHGDREIYAEAIQIVEGAEPIEWPASGIGWRSQAIRLAQAGLTLQEAGEWVVAS